MTTLEIVLIAAAVVVALVVLYNIWVKIIIPTWDALVDAYDWTVDACVAVKDFVVEYIIDPIKSAKKYIHRKFFMTPLERAKAQRDDLIRAAAALQQLVDMGLGSDQESVDMILMGVEGLNEAIADKEARDAEEAAANA